MIKEFKDIIGTQSYSTFLQVLKRIGSDARTHRISVVIAAMLRFALSELSADCDEGTLGHALITLDEEPHLAAEDSEEYELVSDLILHSTAIIRYQRTNSPFVGYYPITVN